MKQNFFSCFLVFLMAFLLTSSHITAPFISVKQGEGERENLDDVADENSLLNMEDADSLNKLMAQEECENGDKECFTRRVLAEAHLDYIYTQHHKEP